MPVFSRAFYCGDMGLAEGMVLSYFSCVGAMGPHLLEEVTLMCLTAGVPNLHDLMPDDLRWS